MSKQTEGRKESLPRNSTRRAQAKGGVQNTFVSSRKTSGFGKRKASADRTYKQDARRTDARSERVFTPSKNHDNKRFVTAGANKSRSKNGSKEWSQQNGSGRTNSRPAGNSRTDSRQSRSNRANSRFSEQKKSTGQQTKTANRKNSVSRANLQVSRCNLPNFSPQLSQASLRSKRTKLESNQQNVNHDALKVIPLGGLCEIGKNMTVYEYGNDMIIVDVGVAFPEEYQPGIDSVIPNMNYVLENRDKLRGIFLTHGHEDHIGSLAYLLSSVDVPVYGGRLTIELVSYKLEDKGIRNRQQSLRIMEAGDHVRAGCFVVEPIHVNHSIADAFALAIDTPSGMVIHSGDFKIDYTPIHGEPINLGRFAALGEQGVLLFVCESTNVEQAGFSSSERTVGDAFAEHFREAKGRILVATFSSNVHRVQQVITAAEATNRKVALVGRSMVSVCRAANNLGYLQMKSDTLIDISEVNQYPPERLVIITTGSQGEPLAALTRMAYAEHRFVQINSSDTVIISATPIPGNEKPIYRVINELYKRGAKVVYSALADIHVSGHAYREEIKIMHQLIRPKYFLPAHGEYRHLFMHAELANEMGQPWDSIYILNNGDIFQISKDGQEAGITGYTEADAILIDGSPTSMIDGEVLDQRRTLSDDGVISIAFAVDVRQKKLLGRPIVQTRGYIYADDFSQMNETIIKRIYQFIEKTKQSEQSLIGTLKSNALRNQLQNVLYSQTQRRPVLLLSIIEV